VSDESLKLGIFGARSFEAAIDAATVAVNATILAIITEALYATPATCKALAMYATIASMLNLPS
jgi:hypothetical protein